MASAAQNPISAPAGVAVVVVAAGVGGLAAMAACTAWQLPRDAMLPSGAICLLGAAAAIVFFARASAERSVIAAIVPAMVIRVAITLLGAAILLFANTAARETIAGWFTYWYMLLLVVEVSWMTRQLSAGDLTAKDAPSC